MDRQLTARENPPLGLLDPALESFDRVWSALMPLPEDDDTSFDHVAGQFVNAQKTAAELVQQSTSDRKDQFVKILEAWDKEHDMKVEEARSRKAGKNFWESDNLVAKVRANISEQHSWKDVFNELRAAKDAYNDPKGVKVVYKWFRKAVDKSELVEPFIDFIPDTKYTSVICAGLKFILNSLMYRTAIKRRVPLRKKFRKEAFDLIDQLPEKIDIVSQYSELYSTDPKLRLATNQLYSNILWAIEGIMFWLTKDHTFEFLKPLLLHNSYDPLKGRIEEVAKASAQVEKSVQLCDSKKLSEIGDGVEVIKQDIAAFKNLIVRFMRAQFQTAKWFARMLSYQEYVSKENQELLPKSYISQKELLLLLKPNTSLKFVSQKSTLERVLRAGFSMDREDQIRAEWLMIDKKVSHWFGSTQSRTLLINGNHSLDRISPVSFFCAMLVQSLRPIESIIVLSHFCGLYTPGDGPAGEPPGSSGLLGSLLTQLVEQWKFGEFTCLDQGDVEKLRSTSPNLDLRDQRHLLRRLVAALPSTKPLFIIVDGINYYETGEFRHETKKAVKGINRLLSDRKIKAMVKIFVASATRAIEVSECFKTNDIVDVPGDMDGTELGFVDAQFNRRFGSKIEKLEHSFSREPA